MRANRIESPFYGASMIIGPDGRVMAGARGPGAGRQQAQGLLVFLLGLGITSGSLAVLGATDPTAGHATELAVLVAANLAATLVRFVLFRAWVFRTQRTDAA